LKNGNSQGIEIHAKACEDGCQVKQQANIMKMVDENGVVLEEEIKNSSPSDTPTPYRTNGHKGFLPGNPGRPKGIPNFSTKLRQSLEKDAPEILEAAIREAKGGNAKMLDSLTKLLLGGRKASYEPTPIPGYADCMTLEEKTACITDAVGNGIVAADVGLAMITGLERSEQAEKLRLLADKLNKVEKVISTTYRTV
jgi:hypothetical protein